MSFQISQEDILRIPADAAVLCIENPMVVGEDAVSRRIGEAGGETLAAALREKRFLSVGRAWDLRPCGLPFRRLIAVGTPHWNQGECNELTVLRLCYRAVYERARELGCARIAMPFLSAEFYGFPREEALRIARQEAAAVPELETVFAAPTPELCALARRAAEKPEIVSYVGWHRDHAAFRLDNGRYALVDLRPEREQVLIRVFVDSCYDLRTDPGREPLPEAEIERLRRIYERI